MTIHITIVPQGAPFFHPFEWTRLSPPILQLQVDIKSVVFHSSEQTFHQHTLVGLLLERGNLHPLINTRWSRGDI